MAQRTKKKLPVDVEIVAELESLYRQLPKIRCQGHCHVSCGVIGMSVVEAQRIFNAAGTPIECKGPDYDCSMLTEDKRCAIHPVRPLICRAFGIVKGLACPFGCEPESWLDEDTFRAIQQRIDVIGKGLYMTVSDVEEFKRAVAVYNARQPEGAVYVPKQEADKLPPIVKAQPPTLKSRIDRVLVQAIIDERK